MVSTPVPVHCPYRRMLVMASVPSALGRSQNQYHRAPLNPRQIPPAEDHLTPYLRIHLLFSFSNPALRCLTLSIFPMAGPAPRGPASAARGRKKARNRLCCTAGR